MSGGQLHHRHPITPYAGELVARKYSRDEEFAADRQAVVLLQRTGYSKELMIDALTWLNGAVAPRSNSSG